MGWTLKISSGLTWRFVFSQLWRMPTFMCLGSTHDMWASKLRCINGSQTIQTSDAVVHRRTGLTSQTAAIMLPAAISYLSNREDLTTVSDRSPALKPLRSSTFGDRHPWIKTGIVINSLFKQDTLDGAPERCSEP